MIMKATAILLGLCGALVVFIIASQEADPPSTAPASSDAEDPPSPPPRMISGPGFDLRLPSQWRRLAKAPALPWLDGGAISFSGPDGCFGAVNQRPREPRTLIAYGKNRVAKLKLKSTHTRFADRVLYNKTTAYRVSFTGTYEDTLWRIQLTALADETTITEILAWSSAPAMFARQCHDFVTARFNWAAPEDVKKPPTGASPPP